MPITGALQLTLQALDGNNQVLFNRVVYSLQNTGLTLTGLTELDATISGIILGPVPPTTPFCGLFVQNFDPNNVVTVNYTDDGNACVRTLTPGAILLLFNVDGSENLSTVIAATISGTAHILVAWWL